MHKLGESDLQELMAALSEQPCFATYIIGDVEAYGLKRDFLSIYSSDASHMYECVVMHYHDDFVLYSPSGNYDIKDVFELISSLATESSCISGKESEIMKIAPFFPDKSVRITEMVELARVGAEPAVDVNDEVTQLTQEDVALLAELYAKIDEFRKKFTDNGADTRKKILRGFSSGRGYGIKKDGALVSSAFSTAESSQSAMITDVCTLSEYRGHGYARSILTRLCTELLTEGRQSVCLYYDNAEAGYLYKSMGFVSAGGYAILR